MTVYLFFHLSWRVLPDFVWIDQFSKEYVMKALLKVQSDRLKELQKGEK